MPAIEAIRERLHDAEMDSQLGALEAVLDAAHNVVRNWESGDLAMFVRDLHSALKEIGLDPYDPEFEEEEGGGSVRAADILEEYAGPQGWDADSQLALALGFIDQKTGEDWRRFLAAQAQDEERAVKEGWWEVGNEEDESCVCSHDGCSAKVYPEDPYYATPCGTYCSEHMRMHADECEVCRSEFRDEFSGLQTKDETDR
jgi:hypothetical protein